MQKKKQNKSKHRCFQYITKNCKLKKQNKLSEKQHQKNGMIIRMYPALRKKIKIHIN